MVAKKGKRKAAEEEPAALFDNRRDVKPAAVPAWLSAKLIESGIPVGRFTARQAFGCLHGIEEKAAKKAAKPTPAQLREQMVDRVRAKLREEFPAESELFDLVCEAMGLMGRAELVNMLMSAGMELIGPPAGTNAPLPF